MTPLSVRQGAPLLLCLTLLAAGCSTPDWYAIHQRGSKALEEGRYEDAERDFLAGLSAARHFPPGDVRLARNRAALARVCVHRNNLDRAELLLDRSLRILETGLPNDHPELAAAQETAVWVHTLRGDRRRADILVEQALLTYERRARKDPGSLVEALLRLGALRAYAHRFDSAQNLFGRALDLLEANFSIGDPRYAEAMLRIGSLQRETRQFREASDTLNESIRTLELASGENQALLARALEERAISLYQMNEPEAALPLATRAAELRQEIEPPVALELADQLERLGYLAMAQGERSRAERFFEDSLALSQERFGPDHPRLADPLTELGRIARAQGKLDQAMAQLTLALTILEGNQALDQPSALPTLIALADLHLTRGEEEGAERRLRQALSIARRNRRLEVSWLHGPVSRVAQQLTQAGQYEPAETLLLQYLDTLEQGPNAEASLIAKVRVQLADIYLLHEKHGHAIAQLERTLRLLRRAYGEDDSRLEETRAKLSELRKGSSKESN